MSGGKAWYEALKIAERVMKGNQKYIIFRGNKRTQLFEMLMVALKANYEGSFCWNKERDHIRFSNGSEIWFREMSTGRERHGRQTFASATTVSARATISGGIQI